MSPGSLEGQPPGIWRWTGVPFFLRTGKRLAEGQRIISIAFREPPKSMFPVGSGVGAQGPTI
jgi:glucose-6-phosphate 1-dehydrogenase